MPKPPGHCKRLPTCLRCPHRRARIRVSGALQLQADELADELADSSLHTPWDTPSNYIHVQGRVLSMVLRPLREILAASSTHTLGALELYVFSLLPRLYLQSGDVYNTTDEYGASPRPKVHTFLRCIQPGILAGGQDCPPLMYHRAYRTVDSCRMRQSSVVH